MVDKRRHHATACDTSYDVSHAGDATRLARKFTTGHIIIFKQTFTPYRDVAVIV